MKESQLEKLNQALAKSFGGEANNVLRMTVPTPVRINAPLYFTSEVEIRERVFSAARLSPRALSEKQVKDAGIEDLPKAHLHRARKLTDEQKAEIAEKWVQTLVASSKKRGRLMTEQQLSDWRLGVRMQPGTRVRYVGSTRDEVTSAKTSVTRETGQLGVISSVTETPAGRLMTFMPFDPVKPNGADDDVERETVALEVLEYTEGWLNLERVPLA